MYKYQSTSIGAIINNGNMAADAGFVHTVYTSRVPPIAVP